MSRIRSGAAPAPLPDSTAPAAKAKNGAASKPAKPRAGKSPASTRAPRPNEEVEAAEEIETDNEGAKDIAHREFEEVFAKWRQTGDPQLRERLILMNRSLVSFIARRFNERGEMSEDIIQQGLIGLINALDNFDPARGVRFATFATPTIMGEIRRYFRDRSWSLRVPRRLQELNHAISVRIDVLTQEIGRSPTYAEIARSLNLQIEEIVEALEMTATVDPLSIDDEVSFSGGESAGSIGDQIGVSDANLENADDHAILQNALAQLSERERQVLQLAYFEEYSQIEIARQMNVSQMFVSRLLRRALATLRELMGEQEA